MYWELTITNRRIILFSPFLLKLTGGTKLKEGKATVGYYAFSDIYVAGGSIVDGKHRMLYYITPMSDGKEVEYPIYFEDSREKIDEINWRICNAWTASGIPLDAQSGEQIGNFLTHCWDVIDQDGSGGSLAYGQRMEDGREVRSFYFLNAAIKEREREMVIDKIIQLANQGATGEKVLEYVSNTPFLLASGRFSYIWDIMNEYPDRHRQFQLAQAIAKMGIELTPDDDGDVNASIRLSDGAVLPDQVPASYAPVLIGDPNTTAQPYGEPAPYAPLPASNSEVMAQSDVHFCPSCGTKAESGSLFCMACGQRLS
jgi:hypothetical protein